MRPKTNEEIKIMTEGGHKLAQIRDTIEDSIEVGMNGMDVENLANDLIKKSGGESSFKKVPKYNWSTCVNVNEVVVHGIPKKETVFQKGDVVSVDVGLFYKGMHTDTSFTKYLGNDKKIQKFLDIGKSALTSAIEQAQVGNTIADISKEMFAVEKNGYKVMRQLVGHGIGYELHEPPQIPCYVSSEAKKTEIPENAVYAIEIMYTMGEPNLVLDEDGWTIFVRDGKITALYEETIAVSKNGPIILTK